jgi:hypothetical protein
MVGKEMKKKLMKYWRKKDMKYKIKNSYVESERKELYVLYVNDKPLCFDEDKGKLEVLLE